MSSTPPNGAMSLSNIDKRIEDAMKILVCGGRNFDDYDNMQSVLSSLNAERGPISLIIHGAASGADRMAGIYAYHHDIMVQEFPADWSAHGRSAGPIRNAAMLKKGRPDLVVAFPGGRGTADMVYQARNAGVEVIDAR